MGAIAYRNDAARAGRASSFRTPLAAVIPLQMALLGWLVWPSSPGQGRKPAPEPAVAAIAAAEPEVAKVTKVAKVTEKHTKEAKSVAKSQPLSSKHAALALKGLSPITTPAGSVGQSHIGLAIAADAQFDDSLAQEEVVAVLTKVLKDQNESLDKLQDQNRLLKARIAHLEKAVNVVLAASTTLLNAQSKKGKRKN